MQGHEHNTVAAVGLVIGGWVERLGDTGRALVVVLGLVGGAFTAGVTVHRVFRDAGDPSYVAQQADRRSARDSVRVDVLFRLHEKDGETARRMQSIEDVLWRVDDRTKRMQCLLAGGSGPSCL